MTSSSTRKLLLFAPAAAFAASLVVLAAQPTSARSMQPGGQPFVQVHVNYNTQLPLAEFTEEALTESRTAATEMLYRLAREECVVLKQILAETCQLTNLNISTNIQNQHGPNPIMLYVNSSASFQITLKEEAAPPQ